MQIRDTKAALGAEVLGIKLADGASDADMAAIHDAWQRRLVLVFRDQQLDERDLISFATRLGELDPPGPNPYRKGPIYPEFPELNVISNIVEEGRPLGNLGDGEAVWHADMTYQETPPKGAVLHAVELPPAGGNTQFANMFSAFDALDDATKTLVDGKRAIHDAAHNSAGMLRRGYAPIDDVRQTPGAHQPLVRTQPGTGRRCLFLGRRPNSYIVGMQVADSEALLDALWAHATQDAFVYTHQWQLGDVLLWDNLSVLHRRDAFDPATRRRLHRAQLKGDGPIAA